MFSRLAPSRSTRTFRYMINQEYRASGLTGKYQMDKFKVNSFERIDPTFDAVYNPQSKKNNMNLFDTPNTFKLRNAQSERKTHDPVGYKKLETMQLNFG